MTLRLWVLGIILPFVSAMVITALVHPVIVKMALKKNMTDAPDYRKLQKQPVPVMVVWLCSLVWLSEPG